MNQPVNYIHERFGHELGLPVNPDKTWHAGADEKTPMEHTRNSVRLVNVIDGPTSANASPTRFSRGKDGS